MQSILIISFEYVLMVEPLINKLLPSCHKQHKNISGLQEVYLQFQQTRPGKRSNQILYS